MTRETQLTNHQDPNGLFAKLTEDRQDSARTLAKPSLANIWTSIVDKYSDQAHFIYELLQNADDTQATYVEFQLLADRLLFIHDGSIGFTLSDQATEPSDTKAGTLGHINSITSVANSSKKDKPQIGKFGVGFKAVYQYTSTPEIYDDHFRFVIRQYIVPIQLRDDYPARKPGETLFCFPFNHDLIQPDVAYTEILERIKGLKNPLLFLKHLQRISWTSQTETGEYTKHHDTPDQIDPNTTATHVTTVYRENNNTQTQSLCQLTRRFILPDKPQLNLTSSVSFWLNADGTVSTDRIDPAYCFFPTKETTHLKFIIQAPFLLTDSREGIKAGDQTNRALIDHLATLAADGLDYIKNLSLKRGRALLGDNVIYLVPTDPTVFNEVNDQSRISFKPFYTKLYDRLKQGFLIPVAHNQYVRKDNAFWADSQNLITLFSNNQLGDLFEHPEARWAFTSVTKSQTTKKIAEYIDGSSYSNRNSNLINAEITPDKLFRRWKPEFIEKQSYDWIKKLYVYLKTASYLWEKKGTPLRHAALFINQNGKASPAYDKDSDDLILFLDNQTQTSYPTVHSEFTSDPDSLAFLKAFGLKEPDLKADLYINILPNYEPINGRIDSYALQHLWQTVVRFLQIGSHDDTTALIEKLRQLEIVPIVETLSGQPTIPVKKPQDTYHRVSSLLDYFNNANIYWFDEVLISSYLQEHSPSKKSTLIVQLRINTIPQIVLNHYEYGNIILAKFDLSHIAVNHNYTYSYKLHDKELEGLENAMENITVDRSLNILLYLISYVATKQGLRSFEITIQGTYRYLAPNKRSEYTQHRFKSTLVRLLTDKQWLFDQNGIPHKPADVSFIELDKRYTDLGKEAENVLELFGLKANDALKNLTLNQLRAYEFGQQMQEAGIDLSDPKALNDLLNLAKQRARQQAAPVSIEPELLSLSDSDPIARQLTHIQTDIRARRENPAPSPEPSEGLTSEDTDEYVSPNTKIQAEIDRRRNRAATEIEALARIDSLTQAASRSEKYSLAWFKYLLELEYLKSSEQNQRGQEINIQFSRVTRDSATTNILILANPSRYIPHTIEDVADLTIRLYTPTGSRTVAIEVVNVRDYTLRARLANNTDLTGLDLTKVTHATLAIKSPVFILEELQKAFNSLPFDADYNLRDHLTNQIEFVFGPPGTGKTTHLARQVLIHRMQQPEPCRILVLTPTNKAADVLTTRIIELMEEQNNFSYPDWLLRYGTSSSDILEAKGVVVEKNTDLSTRPRHVVITTVARFPYDGFKPDGAATLQPLRDLPWDYIVFDEASMIGLAAIVFPLYHCAHHSQFIIAGDPFQIAPITQVEQWQGENIYTMTQLKNFARPSTVPHNYPVTNLTTQYRSIPAIGELFSQFMYNGILAHHRPTTSQRPLYITGLPFTDLNFITYPVNNNDTLYRAQKLNGTNYHVYSALLTFELTQYIATQIEQNNTEFIRIGIICPYRPQANIVQKLVATLDLDTDRIDVQVGTIHGFQGDQCHLVITLLNPPNPISDNPNIFLNRQNILNVAISRAQDYQIIILPDSDTANIDQLQHLTRIQELARTHAPHRLRLFTATDIEEVIFAQPDYIHANTFSTTHQNVNVYSKPQHRYEVRCEEYAIDVQIKN